VGGYFDWFGAFDSNAASKSKVNHILLRNTDAFLRRCHRQRIVCGADHDLRYFAISSPVRPIDLAAL